MGIINDLRRMTIAMEVDDVTQSAQAQTKNIAGNTTATGEADDTGDDGKDDISKTDDIFGIEENKNNQKGNTDNNSDNNDQTDDDPDDAGDNDTTDPNLDNTETPDGEEDDTDSSPDMSSGDSPKYYDKEKLKENMIHFYNIIMTNVSTVSELQGKANNRDTIVVCNIIIDNLRTCATCLYEDLTNNLEKYSYEELLKDYVTIKRVFDICVEILSKHFDNTSKIIGMKKKRK